MNLGSDHILVNDPNSNMTTIYNQITIIVSCENMLHAHKMASNLARCTFVFARLCTLKDQE